MRMILALVLGLATAACSDDDSSSSSGAAGKTGPAKACEDMADAVAKAAVRCGQTYQANYDAFTNQVGGCANIKSVRDESGLRNTCMPSLGTISCEDLRAAKLDETCKAQLLK
jgi:hypothetical protein